MFVRNQNESSILETNTVDTKQDQLNFLTYKDIIAKIRIPTENEKHLFKLITTTKHPILCQLKEAVKHYLVTDVIIYKNRHL